MCHTWRLRCGIAKELQARPHTHNIENTRNEITYSTFIHNTLKFSSHLCTEGLFRGVRGLLTTARGCWGSGTEGMNNKTLLS